MLDDTTASLEEGSGPALERVADHKLPEALKSIPGKDAAAGGAARAPPA